MPFEAQLVAWGLGLLTLFIGSVFALLKWFFARYINGIDRRIATLEEAIDREADKRRELEREYRDFLARLPEKYVARDDWIIMVSKMENKIDAVASMLNDVIKDFGRGYR